MLAIIQSRFNSARLPGKALMPIHKTSVLERTIAQVKKAKLVKKIIVATSTEKHDDSICQMLSGIGVDFYRGELDDVGHRVLNAAQHYNAPAFVRICGDSPFLDWRIVDESIKLFHSAFTDLVSNVFHRTFPKGQSVEVISTDALYKLCKTKRSLSEKEHLTKGFYANFTDYKIISITSGGKFGECNHCIDIDSDLLFANQMIKNHSLDDASWQEIETVFQKSRSVEGDNFIS
jgi:spore coat polysaccharide biosynthesis protein SpsF (cytidylyltransferase family)